MDFKKFLEDESINEELVVEKVTKDTNSILKPYTKEICDELVSNGINPQSPETSFVKLDNSVVDEMITSPQIFKIFKRTLVGNKLANVSSNKDKTLINNGQWFIATASKDERCVTALLFTLDDEERKIRLIRRFGLPVGFETYAPVLFSKVFKELVTKGDTVSIFVVTTTQAEKSKLKKMLSDRRENKQYYDNNYTRSRENRRKEQREIDLINFKFIKKINEYGVKINKIVDDAINTLTTVEPDKISYEAIQSQIEDVRQALGIINKYKNSTSTWDIEYNRTIDYLKDISSLNESVPNDVRRIFKLGSYRPSDIYKSLLRANIAAESADYTILDDEAYKYNKSPAFDYWDYKHKDIDYKPVRINLIEKLLKKYDAVALITAKDHLIVYNVNGNLKFEGEKTLFNNELFTIVGISGGNLESVLDKKNSKIFARMEKVNAEILDLLYKLSDILNNIDYRTELYYEKRDNINKALEICYIINKKCDSVILRK